MANISNPRKLFCFSIRVIGAPIQPFLFQQVSIPEAEVDQVEHGDLNYDVKTGGRKKFGDCKLEKLLTTTSTSQGEHTYFWDWQNFVQNASVGAGAVPTLYKRTLEVKELAEDLTTVLNTWILIGCWPKKISGFDFDRMKSDNTIESVELSVDLVEKL